MRCGGCARKATGGRQSGTEEDADRGRAACEGGGTAQEGRQRRCSRADSLQRTQRACTQAGAGSRDGAAGCMRRLGAVCVSNGREMAHGRRRGIVGGAGPCAVQLQARESVERSSSTALERRRRRRPHQPPTQRGRRVADRRREAS
ncbi:hypothetical protein C8Q76DRAFT_726496 [Earliella scabrosa]|nr:hypothetical protein C8Q76DRAFT_726496 [Earliella scabrosa]